MTPSPVTRALQIAQALGRQVFLTMHELFDRLARKQPVAIVLEDWHWVDHSSVALCEHLLPLTRNRIPPCSEHRGPLPRRRTRLTQLE